MSPEKEVRVAQADKTKPLRAQVARGGRCALCGCEMEPGAWVVKLPNGLGMAQTHCAGDRGWEIT